jgi:hypothetical protein
LIESYRYGDMTLGLCRAADVDLAGGAARTAAGGTGLLVDQVNLDVVDVDRLGVVCKEWRGGGVRGGVVLPGGAAPPRPWYSPGRATTARRYSHRVWDSSDDRVAHWLGF